MVVESPRLIIDFSTLHSISKRHWSLLTQFWWSRSRYRSRQVETLIYTTFGGGGKQDSRLFHIDPNFPSFSCTDQKYIAINVVVHFKKLYNFIPKKKERMIRKMKWLTNQITKGIYAKFDWNITFLKIMAKFIGKLIKRKKKHKYKKMSLYVSYNKFRLKIM